MKKELICLDMDNTLLYSDKVHAVAFNRAFKKNGLPQLPVKDIIYYFGLAAKDMVGKLVPDISKEKMWAVINDHDDFVVNDTVKYVRVIPGVKRALKILREHYKLALLSNCKHREVVATIKAAGIEMSTFIVMVGNDEVKHPKPNPDEIRKAMWKARTKKGYMVGDTTYDIDAGRAAGLKTIAVLSGNHSRARLKGHRPDYIIKSVADLPKLLINNQK